MSVIELSASPSDLRALAEQSNAWPFEQAKAIAARLKKKPKDEVLFETGYGPSGLPHIGTFGEVARTTMVRHAFRVLTEDKIKTRLLAFSDDMDGLRKVPDNVPNKELLERNLGKPLTKVPDPFGTHSSFGAHNNARLRAFLDTFGFDYEFASSTDYYTSGKFDATLLRMLERIEKVMAINLKSAFFGTQLAAKQMIAQGGGGRIINMTSVHQDWPMPGNTAYCLSKGGMRMLTRTAGVELGPHNICVVGVGPGFVWLHSQLFGRGIARRMHARSAVQRVHLQAGIVSKHDFVGKFAVVQSFACGVLGKAWSGFFEDRNIAEIGQKFEFERGVAGEFPVFA